MALDLFQNFVSVQYLENKFTEFHEILYMHLYWQYLRWDCFTSFFCTFVSELWPLIYSTILFPLNILQTNGQILTKLYLTIYTDKIYVWSVTCHFSHICSSVMALDFRQNFVSNQYLENKWTEFHQILYMHSYWQDLCWDCNTSFFAHLYQSYGPLFIPKIRFRSISWQQMERFWPNFI